MSKKFFTDLQKQYTSHKQSYRALVRDSNEALNMSKRAIFAFHRDDIVGGKKLLIDVLKVVQGFEPLFKKEPALRYEGVYAAALEEYVEAQLLLQFLEKKPLGAITTIKALDAEVFLGGLSDLTGELVRYAIARATEGDEKEVKRAHVALEKAMMILVSLDLTGKLRTKYDQAKNSLRKMESIVYDLSLKRR